MRVRKDYTLRDVRKIMRNNGYSTYYYNGGHQVFSNGRNTIPIPSHTSKHKCINRYLFNRIVKTYNLSLSI